MCLGKTSNAHYRSERQMEEYELKAVTKGAEMARERLRGSSGTERNTIDGETCLYSLKRTTYNGALYTKSVGSQLIQKYSKEPAMNRMRAARCPTRRMV